MADVVGIVSRCGKNNKAKHFSYKGGYGICISSHLKKLAWAIDKQIIFKTVVPVRN